MQNFLADAEATEAAWYDVIGRFRAAADELDRARARLVSADLPAGSDLAEERDALLSRMNALESSIRTLRSAFSAVGNAWDWFTGLFGPDEELGILPALPFTYVAAAGVVTAMTGILLSYRIFARRLDVYEDARANGSTPAQAASIAEKASGGSSIWTPFSIPWGQLAGVAALAAGALVVYRMRRR